MAKSGDGEAVEGKVMVWSLGRWRVSLVWACSGVSLLEHHGVVSWCAIRWWSIMVQRTVVWLRCEGQAKSGSAWEEPQWRAIMESTSAEL